MKWIKSEKKLKDFVNEPNQKNPSIKFSYKLDCKRIEFLDTLVYIDQQNKLQTTQVIVKTFLMQNQNILQPSTSNSTNMLNIPRLPQSLWKTY